MDTLNAGGNIEFSVNGENVSLSKEDLLIEMVKKEGYVSENDNVMTVVLDTNLTDELIEEGFVREIISKIQTMRKEAGFEVMDRIKVYSKNSDKIAEILNRNKEELMSEVLADDVIIGETLGYEKEWNINGEDVTLSVMKQN